MMDRGSFGTDSLEDYLERRGSSGGVVYLALLLLVAGALVATPLVRFPVAIRATGYLRMAGDTHTLLAPATARVIWTALRSGQIASRGDTVLVLEETGAVHAPTAGTGLPRQLAAAPLVVTAPISGTIAVRVPLAPGSIVAAGQPVGAIIPLAPLQAEVLLDARERERVRVGQPATIEVDGYGALTASEVDGRVAFIGAEVERIGGRQVTRVRVQPLPAPSNPSAPERWMVRGASVAVRIPLGRRTVGDFGKKGDASSADRSEYSRRSGH